ncbi:MAG: response regulator [Muribaculaceae bacterium]|nr:response regulator [Muribaculaceae bacterium]
MKDLSISSSIKTKLYSLFSQRVSSFMSSFFRTDSFKTFSFIARPFRESVTLFILGLIFLLSTSITAHPTEYIFTPISLSDGLTNPSVKCALRDSKDYLWIGTKNGLNRYDKGNMKTYKRNHTLSNTLPDNEIIEIFEDKNGTVWIVCSTGVVTYDRKNDNFQTMTVDGKILRSRSHLLTPTGIIFGGAGVLFNYNYETGNISQLPSTGGSEKYYTAIHPWTRDKYLLMTRWDGVWTYNTKTGATAPSNVITGKRIIASFVDSEGDLWISEYGKGISFIDRSGIYLPIPIDDIRSEGIVLDIQEKDGKIYFATDGLGIYAYEKSTGKSHKIDSDEDAPRALRSVNCLYKDPYDNIFAGTVRGGLYYISPTPMKTIPLSPEMEAYTVTSIVDDNNNKAWIGVDGNGILLFEPENHNHVTPVSESNGLKIVSMDNYDENSLLISTYDSGLFILDKKSQKILPAPNWMHKISEANKATGIPMDIKRLSGNKIALITDKIYISDLTGIRIAVIELEGKNNRIRVFYNDIGNMLVYTDNEVFNVEYYDETVHSLFKLKDNIECAAYDGSRFIYAGTSSGIQQYDFETGEVSTAATGSRMPPGSGITALAYSEDELWIGALGQLFLRNIRDGGIRSFGPKDGVTPNEFIYKAVLTTPRYVLMGGVNGLLKINLEELSKYNFQKTQVPLELSEVLVDGLPVNMNENIAKLPGQYSTVKLRLTGGHSNPMVSDRVRIYVGGKTLNSAIETTDNSLTVGHLQATRGGRYDIYASTRDFNGEWTSPELVGALLVPVSWWRKPLAIVIICVLGAAVLTFAAIYFFSKRRSKKKYLLEEHRRQSLEKEVGFLMNLNYELRTPLTLIYSRLKLLNDKVNKGEISEQKMLKELDNIYRSTGKMRDIINTTVDLWRSGDMKTGEILVNVDVDDWVKEIVGEMRHAFNDKKIIVNTDGVKNGGSMICDLKRASIALLNVLRSTINHAAEKSKINIETSEDPEYVRILISFYNDESHGAGEEFRYADHLMALMDGELVYSRNENGVPSVITMKFPKVLKRQMETVENLPSPNGSKVNFGEQSEETDKSDDTSGLDLSNLSVLIVEDEPELRELLVSSLSPFFKKVLESSNGKDALTHIKNSNPDLIITEARLPAMTGLELCRIIKKSKEYSHIPVIMLTTRLEEMSIANGNNFGADNYLTKPFNINVLVKRCTSVLKSFDRVKQWYKSQNPTILPAEKRHNNDSEAFIRKIREIIEQNISKPGFGVDDIVNQLLLSRSTLYGRFKELTGQSLGNYINEFKLTRAKEMLSSTNMSMVEISDELGFATQRYFSTFFKDKTGKTPSAYRAEQLKTVNENETE